MYLEYNNRINKIAILLLKELGYKDSMDVANFFREYDELNFIKRIALKRVIKLKEEFEYNKQDYVSLYEQKYKDIHNEK